MITGRESRRAEKTEKDTYIWTRARSEREGSRELKKTRLNRASKASEKAKDRAPPQVRGASGGGRADTRMP